MTTRRLLMLAGVVLALAGIAFMAWRARYAIEEDAEPLEVG